MNPLVLWTERGLYCPAGDFYVDPHRGVDTAVLTHAHSDHARRGSRRYLSAQSSVGLIRSRLGSSIQIQGLPYGEKLRLGAAWVSLHPAGHMLGSAQVRIEVGGEVWVCSGDYKRDPDPSCEPFEVVRCDTFITEATFGTPSYHWPKSKDLAREIMDWWKSNVAEGFNSVLFGYSIGKAQRVLALLAGHAHRPVLLHSSVLEGTRCYQAEGVALCETRVLDKDMLERLSGELVIAPPSAIADWECILGPYKTAFASGWMSASGGPRMQAYDHGFVISDHADWEDLNRTIHETGARRIFVQHRGSGALVRHLREQGLEAFPIEKLTDSFWPRETQLSLL